jgi:heme O synthase-like polyprenyltransferase
VMSAPAAPGGARLSAWFDLARAGNFPSVASNVIAALVLSSPAGPSWPPAGLLTLTIVAGCLVYAGGATFNDVADAGFDALHRPERPIPRRIITRSAAAWGAGLQMAVGLGLLVAAGASVAWAGALAATILLYDWIHKRWSGSVMLMAGCRVLLAFTLASLPAHDWSRTFLGWVGVLFLYIVTLSLLARWEYKLAPAPVSGGQEVEQSGAAPMRAAKVGRAVGRLLAFIPLVDAIALLLVGAWMAAMVCVATIPLGRWAQRLAAST